MYRVNSQSFFKQVQGPADPAAEDSADWPKPGTLQSPRQNMMAVVYSVLNKESESLHLHSKIQQP